MRTLSLLKARTGGYVGRGHVHPALVDEVREAAAAARSDGLVHDCYVGRCGDAVALLLSHDGPPGSPEIAALGREAFTRAAAVALRLGQHRVPGNGGLAIAAAEISFEEREDEPVLCFLTQGAPPGAFSLALYRAFGDPFNTPGLLASEGFSFVTADAAVFDLPEGLHGLLQAVHEGAVVREVLCRATGEVASEASVGDDPALIVRCEDGFPSVGECLEPFAHGSLMPVSTNDDGATRSGCPARVVGLGFQVTEGRLVGPRDLLGDRAFDEARRRALESAQWRGVPARTH